MKSESVAERVLQTPTPSARSPASRLPPLLSGGRGSAQERQRARTSVRMGKNNKVAPEGADLRTSDQVDTSATSPLVPMPDRSERSEGAGTTTGAVASSTERKTGGMTGVGQTNSRGNSRNNSRSNSRRPSLSGPAGSRRASFDSTHSDGTRGDAYGDSVAVPMGNVDGSRSHRRQRHVDGGGVVGSLGISEDGSDAIVGPREESMQNLHSRQRDSVVIDKEVWLSAMGELSGDKMNQSFSKKPRKLSVAAVAEAIPDLTGLRDDQHMEHHRSPGTFSDDMHASASDRAGQESPSSIGGEDYSRDDRRKTQVDSFLEKIFGQSNDDPHEELPENLVWLSPDDVIRQQWDLLIIVCVVYNCLVIPLRLAFGDEDEDFSALAFVDWFVDFLFLADIYLNFHTGFDDDGIIITDKTEVRRRYMRTWFGFDLLISLPLDLPFALAGGDRSQRLYFRIPRLLRLLRVPRALRYLSHWDDKLAIDGAALRMSKLIFMILMYAHTNACLQFFISRLEDFPEDGWVVRTGVLDDSEAKQYTVALFNALSHMLCIGYGQHSTPWPTAVVYEIDPPAPQTVTEIWITIISMSFGASLFVILIGLMSSLMLSMDRAGALYTHKVNVWKQYFKYRRLPKEIRERIMKYYECRWFTRKVFDEESLLKELPYCLKQDVHAHICQYLLDRIPIFTLCQLPVSRALVTHLKPLGCLQDDFIYIYGQIAEEMYFIVKGGVELIKGDGTVSATLMDGSYFGEAPLLNQAVTIRMASARATAYTNLYSLSTRDFFDIAEVYPEARNLLKQFALAGSESRTTNSLGLDDSI